MRQTMGLVIVTSAPDNTPLYLGELLNSIAIPVGLTAQFTYRDRWISSEALKSIPEESGQEPKPHAVLVFAEATENGTKAYPIRYVSNVTRNESRGQARDKYFQVKFILGPLYQYSLDPVSDVKTWSEAVAPQLETKRGERIFSPDMKLVQSVNGTLNDATRGYTDESDFETRWNNLSTLLSGTRIKDNVIWHLKEVYKDPLADGYLRRIQGIDANYCVRLESARTYGLRVFSLIPKTVTNDVRARVRSDFDTISTADGGEQIWGAARDETPVLKVQRISEVVQNRITISVMDSQGNLPNEVHSAKVVFTAECAPDKFKFRSAAILVLGGLAMTQVGDDLLKAWFGIGANNAVIAAFWIKIIGGLVAAIAAYSGFRKVPGG
jgi:hypothetical protein